jgi:glycosyltransferase involved in cell wall biosynthesis
LIDSPVQILIGQEDAQRVAEARLAAAPLMDYRLVAEQCSRPTIAQWHPPPSGLRGPWLVRTGRSILGNLGHARKLVRSLQPGSIVYSTGETWGLPLGLAGVVARPRRFVHVIYVHRVFSAAWLGFLRAARNRLAVDGWICVTRTQADLLRRAVGSCGKPVAVISQGVDTTFFDTAKGRPPQDPPYILAVGAEMRNYHLLFEAAHGLKAEFVVKASSAWMSGARNELKGVPSNVRVITQRLPYVELRELYAGAELIVAPLCETPQAAGITTILEGMAMGKCVVATESSGLPDVLVNQSTGVVVPPTVESLRGAIAALWETPDRRAMLARSGQLAVRTGFTLERHAAAVTEFLLKIAEGRLS